MRRGYSDAPLLVVDIDDSDSGTSSTSGSGRQTPELLGEKRHRSGLKHDKPGDSNAWCSPCFKTMLVKLCFRNIGHKTVMVARQLKKLLDPKNLFVVNIMVLFFNLFFLVMQINKGFWPVETYFQPVFNRGDKKIMIETMKLFMSTLVQNNITAFMYAGTLIGSYRHHGFIPWDDDVDIIVNGSEKHKIVEIFAKLEPEYKLYRGRENIFTNAWKFYSDKVDTKPIHKNFKWPYVDIFFFGENATHVYDEYVLDYSYVYPKNKVFPLTLRPFMDSFFPAPCDTKYILDTNYELDLCRSRSFSHMMEVPMFTFSTKDVPCSRLQNYFPFVERTAVHNGFVNETLRMADWTLGSLSLPLSTCHKEGT